MFGIPSRSQHFIYRWLFSQRFIGQMLSTASRLQTDLFRPAGHGTVRDPFATNC